MLLLTDMLDRKVMRSPCHPKLLLMTFLGKEMQVTSRFIKTYSRP